MEQKPHQHLWAYRGLEYKIGGKKITWQEREYFDVYFCQHCLEENLVPRNLGNHTSREPIAGSTPRGPQPGELVEEREEEKPPEPIEHAEPGKLDVHETVGWFPKAD